MRCWCSLSLGICSVCGTQSVPIHVNWYRQPHSIMNALYAKLLHSRRFDKCSECIITFYICIAIDFMRENSIILPN